jgi:Kelch motif
VLLAAALVPALAAAVVFAADRAGDQAPRATDSWGALAPSPLARTEVGAARVADRIYVVGGFISTGGTTGGLAAYDISEDRWVRLRDLPIAVNHAGVTALEGRLYVLGGDLGGGGKSARLYRYSPENDRWRRLPDAPTARSALAFVGIGHKLYAAGGASATDDTMRTLEIYDLERRRWTRGPKMPTGRNHVGATYFKRGVVVTGGRPGPVHGGLTTVEYYQPQTRSWKRWPPLAVARSGHAAVAIGRAPLGGRVVVFGGEELDGGTTIEEVEVFSPSAGGWSRLPDMVTPRHGVGGAAKGLRVYALEGGPRPGLAFSSALEYLDLAP